MKVFYGQIAVIILFVINLVISYHLCGDTGWFWGYFILCCLFEVGVFFVAFGFMHRSGGPDTRVSDEELKTAASKGNNEAWKQLVERCREDKQ